MMGGICAAVDTSTALGLRLAGVDRVMIWTKGDDPSSLREWFRSECSSEMGVMILSPDAFGSLSAELLGKRSSGKVTPVVVVLPVEGEDRRAVDLMRRAVGMDHGPVKGGV